MAYYEDHVYEMDLLVARQMAGLNDRVTHERLVNGDSVLSLSDFGYADCENDRINAFERGELKSDRQTM